ncbi:uncharacterized protein N0V89_010131 [Didymosphaeria variabile]|uniref:Uncharacterized protein n=1 Tax=Didymosphaeria variabile TaxID=1932322 RepID=A0A9W8XEN1_9PLEO|nr:uncharacterized protein N0V89_010131 [Didymosphaeria variabile]KAJ4348753.1 hypothetical protein N0V89_010131 [Didymosphaeria variabile]
MRGRFIVPVEPAAGDGEVVVVEVLQEGSHPLDVRLVGCEGESPYVAKISHRNISKLKHKFKGTAEEWEQVLSHFLLEKQPEGDAAKLLENVRMVYALKGENIEITIQQDVKGIKASHTSTASGVTCARFLILANATQVNLGEILLPKDDDFEFNPFEWAQASAQAHIRTLKELADSKTQAHGEQDTIAKLNAQLDDFIKTKNETETAMLQQFMELLNEKKRKIRDQNRLLASVKVDKDTATTVQATRQETKPRKAAPSRTSKRKAKAPEPEPEPELEPEQLSADDQMEINQAKAEEQDDVSDDGGAATPDRASETETEDDGEGGFISKAPAPSARATRGKSAQAARSSSAKAQSAKSTPAPDEDAGPPPPRRELPFGRPVTRNKPAAKQPPAAADEDSETDDEEL